MAVQFSAFDPTSISSGSIPDKIRFYYSNSKKIGNYFYCYPISSEAKSFVSAESWASDSYNYGRSCSSTGNFLYDEVDNEFKDIQLFGIAERSMTNRRLFKVILNRKFVVELSEEMLLETLMGFGAKKGGLLNGSFRFGLFNSQLKLYPRIKHIDSELEKLNKEKKLKESITNKSKTKTHTNTKLTYKIGHVYKSGSKAIEKYVFIDKTPNGKYLFLKYNNHDHNHIKQTSTNCLSYSEVLKNKKIELKDICNNHLHLTNSKPKYIIELSDVFNVFSLNDLKTHLQTLDNKKDQSFFDKHYRVVGISNVIRDHWEKLRYKSRIHDIFNKSKKINKLTIGNIYSKSPYDGIEYIYLGKNNKSGKDMFVNLYTVNAINQNYKYRKTIKTPSPDDIKNNKKLSVNEIPWCCIFIPEKNYKTMTFYHEEANMNIKIFSIKDLENQIRIYKQCKNLEFIDLDNRNSGVINTLLNMTNNGYPKNYIDDRYNDILKNF